MAALWEWWLVIAGTWSIAAADILVYLTKAEHRSIEAEFKDLSAAFGGTIPPQGLRALIVYSSDRFGCNPIQPPPWNHSDIAMRWAVLMSQGECNFEQKIRQAQAAMYDIAIVHSYNSSVLVRMDTDHPEGITIPSVFIGFAAGHSLRENYQYNQGYYVIIDDDESPFDLLHILGPLSAIVAICFITMIGFMIGKCIKDRRRTQRYRMPSSSLRRIPTTKFRRKTDPYETCAICLEDFAEGEKLRVLPCSHAYHCKCIDPWLIYNRRVCPMCKRRVFAENEQVPSDSESGSDDDRRPLLTSGNQTTSGGTFAPPSAPRALTASELAHIATLTAITDEIAHTQTLEELLRSLQISPSILSTPSSSVSSPQEDAGSLLSFQSSVAPSDIQGAIPVVVTLPQGGGPTAPAQNNETQTSTGRRAFMQSCITS